MNGKSLLAAMAASFAAMAAPAQTGCPKEKTSTVPQSVAYGASVSCSGLTYSIPGLTITTTTGCPLFVTVTPAHEVAVPSESRTQVQVHRLEAGKILFFQCRTSYLIFIPISSTCAFDRDVNFGAYPRMTTVPCADLQG